MKNNVLIATALNDHARIYLFNSKDVVEKVRQIFDMWPTSCAALGRTLSVTALMGLMQKDENEVVTVTINGGGSIGTIMCVANCNGEVKGFCGDPQLYLKYNETNKLAVGLVVGKDGYLKVTKNLKLKQQYTSQVALQTGEIGDDFVVGFTCQKFETGIELDISHRNALSHDFCRATAFNRSDIIADKTVNRIFNYI